MIPWRVRAHSTDHMSTDRRLRITRAAPAKFADDCLDGERAVRARDRRNRLEDVVPSRHALRMVALMATSKGTAQRVHQVTLMPQRGGRDSLSKLRRRVPTCATDEGFHSMATVRSRRCGARGPIQRHSGFLDRLSSLAKWFQRVFVSPGSLSRFIGSYSGVAGGTRGAGCAGGGLLVSPITSPALSCPDPGDQESFPPERPRA